jgi:hypothetical protein
MNTTQRGEVSNVASIGIQKGELPSFDVIDQGTVLMTVPDTWDASLCEATRVSIFHQSLSRNVFTPGEFRTF